MVQQRHRHQVDDEEEEEGLGAREVTMKLDVHENMYDSSSSSVSSDSASSSRSSRISHDFLATLGTSSYTPSGSVSTNSASYQIYFIDPSL